MTEVAVSERVIELLKEYAVLTGIQRDFNWKAYTRREPGSDLWQVNMPELLYTTVLKVRQPGETFTAAAERVMRYSIDWAKAKSRDGQSRRMV